MTLDSSYFDRLYADSQDPWSFESRWYERRKYAISLACLPRRRYRRAFEMGCSIGVLTALLADRCDELLAVDASNAAVEQARIRTHALNHVRIEHCRIPEQWPHGTFDLLVLSEIGYYFSARDLPRLITKAVHTLEPGGTLLAVHWRHPVSDYPMTGDDVHAALDAEPALAVLSRHEELDFRLDVLVRVPPALQSVAQAEGLVP